MLLEAHGLHKSFSRHHAPAVQNISLRLDQGEVLGIIGESGCGKSTLARLLTGLVQADAGEIHIEGRAPHALSRVERARSIQLVFQDPAAALHPRQRIGQALLEILQSVGGWSRPQAEQTLHAWLPRLDLDPELLLRYPHQLSGGQKQRVCFLRALLLEPKILVLDEPLTALDRMTQARVLALFQTLREQIGFSAIFISHDLSMVQRIADRVAVMYAGRWLEQGPTAAILKKPQHPYTRFLLQSLPKLYRDPGLLPIPAFRDAVDPPPRVGCPVASRCPFALPACGQPLLEPQGQTFSACIRHDLSGL